MTRKETTRLILALSFNLDKTADDYNYLLDSVADYIEELTPDNINYNPSTSTFFPCSCITSSSDETGKCIICGKIKVTYTST